MYTSLDKAIVAAVMGALGLIGAIWHPIGISSDTVAFIVSVAVPVLVYFIPNLPKDQS